MSRRRQSSHRPRSSTAWPTSASAPASCIALDVATGKLKWKYRAASSDIGIGESSPAVAGGIVYIGDLAGVFHAVDAATGKARWTFKTGAEIKSSPVVVGTIAC